jgi:mRNA interferase RelE/StbE
VTWTVEFDDRARKELRKLDKKLQNDILKYLRERVAVDADPRRFGKPLSYDKHGLWRYRVQDARIVCRIEDNTLFILVVRVGNRKDIYKF